MERRLQPYGKPLDRIGATSESTSPITLPTIAPASKAINNTQVRDCLLMAIFLPTYTRSNSTKSILPAILFELKPVNKPFGDNAPVLGDVDNSRTGEVLQDGLAVIGPEYKHNGG